MKKNFNNLLKTYFKDGYVNLGQIVSKNESKKLSNRVLDLMTGKKRYKGMFFQLDGKGGSYKKINTKSEKFVGPSLRYRKIKDLEYDDLFHKVIKNKYLRFFSKKLIGKNVSCMRAMVLNKLAKDSSSLKFHQDVSDNWNMTGKPTFTFWMSLNGATKKKGCLKIINGSHILEKIGKGHFVSNYNLKKLKKNKIKYLELKPGEAIIFNNYLIHGSEKNKTSEMRLAFTVCLMDANIKHKKYSKKYPIIFGKNALKAYQIKNLNQIPKKPYIK